MRKLLEDGRRVCLQHRTVRETASRTTTIATDQLNRVQHAGSSLLPFVSDGVLPFVSV
jgi:hypothetical protein